MQNQSQRSSESARWSVLTLKTFLSRPVVTISLGAAGALLAATLVTAQQPNQSSPAKAAPSTAANDPNAMVTKYCVGCHNNRLKTAGLSLEGLDGANPAAHADVWERVVIKLRAGSMPPPGLPRPDAATYHAIAVGLETKMDQAWAANPLPGRVGAVQRLNRTEYNNAIRDLLGLDIDVKPLLPGDETADGAFDNFADALSISTAHLERYMSVARQVTRLAIGLPPTKPDSRTWRMDVNVLQNDRQSEDLPFGSRGGMAVPYNFPVSGDYVVKVRLQRQYQDYLKGMGWEQQLDVRLDGKLVKRFKVGGKGQGRPAASSYAGDGEPGFAGDPEWETYMQLTGDQGLEIRFPATAGPHTVGVSFVREVFADEGLPQPTQRGRVISNDQVYMGYANVGAVTINGPFASADETKLAIAKATPSRERIFVCYPSAQAEEPSCASTILSKMARLAYRRPVTKKDTDTLMEFFKQGREEGSSFDEGIQFALERLLVDPDFLLRIYRDPAQAKPAQTKPAPRNQQKQNRAALSPAAYEAPGQIYRLSDLELASRLSFFLWATIPDDALLKAAEAGKLHEPATLLAQTRRMLKDPRATDTLVNNFAAQWLNLRLIQDVVVDPDRYPNYDLSLIEAFRTETTMFVASTIYEDRPVSSLLDSDYTFVNERLAEHYKIPGVYGTRFRRVTLPDHNQRGGLFGQGALLVMTSYPDRTSPVLRGKWLLNNIFGLPIPAPPPDVDSQLESAGQQPKTIKERLAQHRKSPTCNGCHAVIDPLGFSLENFDVLGAWRTVDENGYPVDTDGVTASGQQIDGLNGLRKLLLQDPEQFPRTLTEKLMAYAIGRPLEYFDRPAVRKIVRDAASKQYRWSALIEGIVQSPGFLERTSVPSAAPKADVPTTQRVPKEAE